MAIFGDTAGLPAESWSDRAGRTRKRVWAKIPRGVASFFAFGPVSALLCVLLCLLAGCAGSNFSSNDLLVDPGRYTVYKCDDLAKRWKIVTAREKELRGLTARASETGGGAVVGSVAYRTEYDAVMGDEKLLQRAAAEKNCALPSSPGQGQDGQSQSTTYQSDQGIR